MHQELTPQTMFLQPRLHQEALAVLDSDKSPKRRRCMEDKMPPFIARHYHTREVTKSVSLQELGGTYKKCHPVESRMYIATDHKRKVRHYTTAWESAMKSRMSAEQCRRSTRRETGRLSIGFKTGD